MRLFYIMPIIAELPRPDGSRVTRVESPQTADINFIALKKTLPVIINTIDSTGHVSFDISSRMVKLLGYSEIDWRRNPHTLWSSILHPEDEQLVLAEYHTPLKESEPRVLEYRILSIDKQTHWIRETTKLNEYGQLETILIDITEEKKHSEELEILLQTAGIFSSRLPLDEIMRNVKREIKPIVPYRTANVMLVENDPDGNPMIKIAYTWGYDEEKVPPPEIKSIPLKTYPTLEKIYNNPNYMIINDTSKDPMWQKKDGKTRGWVRSWLGVPIRYKGKVIGFINCNSPETDTYTEDSARFLQAMADQIGVAVENANKNAQLLEQSRQLTELSLTDPLTGLANRRRLMDVLEHEVNLSHRYKKPLSLLLLDFNRFKDGVNDTYGHLAGDLVLKAIGILFRENKEVKRGVDLAARYGEGDEFCVVLPGMDRDNLEKYEKRVLEVASINLPKIIKILLNQYDDTLINKSKFLDFIQDLSIKGLFSLGTALYGEFDNSPPDTSGIIKRLLAYADKQLYINKSKWRHVQELPAR